MEQNNVKKSQNFAQIGHDNFLKYPFSQNSKRIRFHGKRIEKELVYFKIKDLVNEGVTSTNELASRLGKSTRQTRRYLKKMARFRMVKLDQKSGRLLKEGINYRKISQDKFVQIPEIAKWVDDCIARQVAPGTLKQYVSSIKYIFGTIRANPKNVISSKGTAIEFWTKFIVEYRKQNPSRGTHNLRVSYRNFLASYEIVFPTRMGKMYGLSSAHDNYGAYAGVCLDGSITEEIGDLMLKAKDIETYTWWRIGLRTAARSRAIAKMTWDHIYFDEKNDDGTESFKLEQHETKDPRGHWFLGENGEWKTKYPPLDLKKLLLEWKSHAVDSRFLWFEDGGSDAQNRKNADRVKRMMIKRLKSYYEQVSSKVDHRTREYMMKRPTHLMRHTLAQQMKDAGLTNEEIADSFGWKTSQIVSTWYTKTSEKKKKELSLRCAKVLF